MEKVSVELYTIQELKEINKDTYDDLIQRKKISFTPDFWDYAKERVKFLIDEGKGGFKNIHYFNIEDFYIGDPYSQGGGACFTYGYISHNLFMEAVDTLIIPLKYKEMLKNKIYILGSGGHSGRYYHENSIDHRIDWEFQDLDVVLDSFETDLIDMYFPSIEKYIIEKHKEYCYEIFNTFVEHYEELHLEEYIIDYFYGDLFTISGVDSKLLNRL